MERPSSLSMSFFVLLRYVYSTVLRFAFWQGTTDAPAHTMLVHADEEAAREASSLAVEAALEALDAKIGVINDEVEMALRGHNDQPATATLRLKLRSVISQIDHVLGELDSLDTPQPAHSRLWQDERTALASKRQQLEQRLRVSTSQIDDDELRLHAKGFDKGFEKVTRKAGPLQARQLSGKKRSQREFLRADDLFDGVRDAVDVDEPRAKKHRSISKRNHRALETCEHESNEEWSDKEDEVAKSRFTAPSGTGRPNGSESKAANLLALLNAVGSTRERQDEMAGDAEAAAKEELLISLRAFGPAQGSSGVSGSESEHDEKADSFASLRALDGDESGQSEGEDGTDGKAHLFASLNALSDEGRSESESGADEKVDLLSSLSTVDGSNEALVVPSEVMVVSQDLLASLERFKAPNRSVRRQSGFDLLRSLNKADELPEKSDSWSDSDERSEAGEEACDEYGDSSPRSLVATHGVATDVNKAGMRRGKKGRNLTFGQKDAKYDMEDAHVVHCPLDMDDGAEVALFCVFDGHAGSGCSQALTRLVPDAVRRHWKQDGVDDSFWRIVYAECDEAVREYEYEGATATTLLLWRGVDGVRRMQCANVGDSTCFLVRDGRALTVSEDHKPTVASERERIVGMGIRLEDGQSRLNGLAVSRALGDHFPKEMNCGLVGTPYVSPEYTLGDKDSHVLLASDGLWDVISGHRAVELLETDAQQSAQRLLKTAVESSKCHDNVTVLVVQLC